jgi:hypothetical protein
MYADMYADKHLVDLCAHLSVPDSLVAAQHIV